MAATECGHGHIYDSDLYASCPYCNSAQQVITFPEAGGGRTETVSGGYGPSSQGFGGFSASESGFPGVSVLDDTVTQPPKGYHSRRRADEDQKTVGDMQQKMGLDPVVGWLVCIDGPEKGKDYRLFGRINSIGRSERMDVCISKDPSISKENHARLGYDPKYNRFRLIPADSQNNIYLNGETVDLPTPIHAFDIIEFGSTKLIFVPLCGDRFSWDMAAPDRNPL